MIYSSDIFFNHIFPFCSFPTIIRWINASKPIREMFFSYFRKVTKSSNLENLNNLLGIYVANPIIKTLNPKNKDHICPKNIFYFLIYNHKHPFISLTWTPDDLLFTTTKCMVFKSIDAKNSDKYVAKIKGFRDYSDINVFSNCVDDYLEYLIVKEKFDKVSEDSTDNTFYKNYLLNDKFIKGLMDKLILKISECNETRSIDLIKLLDKIIDNKRYQYNKESGLYDFFLGYRNKWTSYRSIYNDIGYCLYTYKQFKNTQQFITNLVYLKCELVFDLEYFIKIISEIIQEDILETNDVKYSVIIDKLIRSLDLEILIKRRLSKLIIKRLLYINTDIPKLNTFEDLKFIHDLLDSTNVISLDKNYIKMHLNMSEYFLYTKKWNFYNLLIDDIRKEISNQLVKYSSYLPKFLENYIHKTYNVH